MEYAKINYNITVPQNPVPVSSVEKSAKFDEGKFSSQANTFPGFHKLLKALGTNLGMILISFQWTIMKGSEPEWPYPQILG